MNNSKDYNPIILDKIDDFVWKPFEEVLSRSFILYRVDIGISCYEIQSGINLQKEVMPKPLSLIFVPGICLF